MFLMFSAVSGGDFENINPVQVPPQKEVHPSTPQTTPVLARRSAAQLTIAIIQKSVSRIFCIINFQFKYISSASFLSQERSDRRQARLKPVHPFAIANHALPSPFIWVALLCSIIFICAIGFDFSFH